MSSEDEIHAWVGRLQNLHEIFLVQGQILAIGPDAVPALREFLERTAPSVCPEPRAAAVECLGAFGSEPARTALIGLLEEDSRRLVDPAVRLAEERVRSAAARALGRLCDPRSVPALLRALERERLIAAGEALAEMDDVLALPGLIACLEEPRKGPVVDAILGFGARAVSLLLAALRTPRSVGGHEPPTSAERRASCAEILGRLRAPEARDGLVARLDDENRAVRAEAAIAIAAIAAEPPPQVATRLAEALGDRDLERQARAEAALGELGARALFALLRTAEGTSGAEGSLPSPEARVTAVKLLARLRAPEVVPTLAPLVDAVDPRLRIAVLRALAAQGRPAAEALRRASNDRVRFVRQMARRELSKLRAREPTGPSRWFR